MSRLTYNSLGVVLGQKGNVSRKGESVMETLPKESGVWNVWAMKLFGFFLLVGYVGVCMIPIMPNWTKENRTSLNEFAFAGFLVSTMMIGTLAALLCGFGGE
ncbi:MAG: hypothetical protein Q7R59_01545 [bacterium]|nr:hypothetical protein [bacterium]